MKTILTPLLLGIALTISLLADPPRKLSDESAKVLLTATNAVLFSLEPLDMKLDQPTSPGYLHGWKILGQTPVSLPQSRTIATNVFKSIVESEFSALCFNPRHALRMTADNQTYDFLLCYECGHVTVISSGKKTQYLPLSGSPAELDAILTAAKIPLAKKGH